MASLPRVVSLTRERVAREFDGRGPEVCRTETMQDLQADNPELLDMAQRCARDVGDFARIMNGFCMFYRVLNLQARADFGAAERLPRVSPDTRANLARRIDAVGSHDFTREVIAEIETGNPELLLMWHNFAGDQGDYLGVMQGFALLYGCLLAEVKEQRGALH